MVRQAIETGLDELLTVYTKDLYQQKCGPGVPARVRVVPVPGKSVRLSQAFNDVNRTGIREAELNLSNSDVAAPAGRASWKRIMSG